MGDKLLPMYCMREKRERNASRMTLVFLACATGQMLVSLAVRETQAEN